jgi:hypothetical protein
MKKKLLATFCALLSYSLGAVQDVEMQTLINTGTRNERIERLAGLGVERGVAESSTSATAPTLTWLPLRTGAKAAAAILFLPCNAGDSAFLYLFANDERWNIKDKAEFDCHYENSVSVELTSAVENGIDDVVVHHANEGHGTGFSQQNFNLFHVIAGRLRLVLDAEKIVRVNRPAVGGDALNETQQSVFVVIPTASRPYIVEETRSITRNQQLSVTRRRFRWSAAKGRYLPSRFVPVVANGD